MCKSLVAASVAVAAAAALPNIERATHQASTTVALPNNTLTSIVPRWPLPSKPIDHAISFGNNGGAYRCWNGYTFPSPANQKFDAYTPSSKCSTEARDNNAQRNTVPINNTTAMNTTSRRVSGGAAMNVCLLVVDLFFTHVAFESSACEFHVEPSAAYTVPQGLK